MIWRTRAEHAAEEAAPPGDAEGEALVDALRAQVNRMRTWAKDEQQKRETAEDARVEARSRAAVLENALAFAASGGTSGESWTATCDERRALREALRALVSEPPWRDRRGSADVWCGWCDATTYGGASTEHFHNLTLHDEACPWRKARALLGLDGRALD